MGASCPGVLRVTGGCAPNRGVVKKITPKATSSVEPKTISRRSPRTVPSKLRSSQSGASTAASGVEAMAPTLHAVRPTRDPVRRGAVESVANNNQRPRNHPTFAGVANTSTPAGSETHATQNSARSASLRTTWRKRGSENVATDSAVITMAADV
jgi:hypothetical protein